MSNCAANSFWWLNLHQISSVEPNPKADSGWVWIVMRSRSHDLPTIDRLYLEIFSPTPLMGITPQHR
ncbi:MAG: hypothetical protein SWY16_09820 [Cyanobacteriota bacterium]|nr:hypothetical protein [Cyanobacteriota bacterium]